MCGPFLPVDASWQAVVVLLVHPFAPTNRFEWVGERMRVLEIGKRINEHMFG